MPPAPRRCDAQEGIRAADVACRAGALEAIVSAFPAICSHRLSLRGSRRLLVRGGAHAALQIALMAVFNLCAGGANGRRCEGLVRAGALEALAAGATNGAFREARTDPRDTHHRRTAAQPTTAARARGALPFLRRPALPPLAQHDRPWSPAAALVRQCKTAT